MSWRTEWKALSDQIEGLLEAGRFYLECRAVRNDDSYSVAKRQLLPHIREIYRHLVNLRDKYEKVLPPIASHCLMEFLNAYMRYVPEKDSNLEIQSLLQLWLTALTSFRSQLNYHLSDMSAVARHLSERAFVHLKRILVVDPDERRKWKEAFEQGETTCERLGASHLLLHGIWAFKVNAQGERTDLVFGEPIKDLEEIERTSEALVLTEWKKVLSKAEVDQKLAEARRQTFRYVAGSLASLELTNYRYLIIISEQDLPMPSDDNEGGIIYRKINIAVDPKPPSRG